MTRREWRRQKTSSGQSAPIVPLKMKKKASDEGKLAPAKEKAGFFRWYENNLKKLMIVPILMILFSLTVIIAQGISTGSYINKGISLTGGQTITITHEGLDAAFIENELRAAFPTADINVRGLSEYGVQSGIIIESTMEADLDELKQTLAKWAPDIENSYSVETIGGTLSQGFFKEILIALVLAFVFMSIVVFILFRSLGPGFAVIAAAVGDMLFTVAIVNILGIKLSTAGIAALLMLIGYSVDSDILLTTRLFKAKKGSFADRTKRAMSTGLTMTGTSIVVVFVGMLISQADVLRQIFTILLIGLLADLPFTWIQNVAILKFYLEKKAVKK